MNSFSCIICGGQDHVQWLKACPDYYLEKPQIVDYEKCNQCETIQQNPIPTDTAKFYDAYPIHQKKSFFHRFIGRIMNGPIYYQPSPGSEKLTLLDYGCGNGEFLNSIRNHFKQVYGYEPNGEHAQNLSKVLGTEIFSNSQDVISTLEQKIDVLCMHMVMEHVNDIDDVFEKSQKVLKSGGLFYIVIPNAISWEAKIFGAKWHGLDSPRHISFPSRRGIEILAEKFGYVIKKQKNVSFANSLAGSFATVFAKKFNFFLFLLSSPFSFLLSRMFSSGSVAYYLEKK